MKFNHVFLGVLMLAPIIGALFSLFIFATLLTASFSSKNKLMSLLIMTVLMAVVVFIHLTFSNLNFTPYLMLAVVVVPVLLALFDKAAGRVKA